ncbi:unnamed protein product [Mytilus coruscus]|uniref:CCHC-type domain-containing protein n=1 Tax=Mytilus coruscus TaxID=42192 RepID=A0A6J8AYQ6_MYTCO|nr:unnamed protein product [Mytilus coruscus]
MEREVRLKELELREKELTQGVVQPQGKSNLKSKLPEFKEGDDPDVFLRSFEKLVVLHKIPKPEWALRLVPLLCGKALEAFSRLSEEDSRDYDKIKTAILSRYELTAEAYREKFRSAGQFSDESFKEFAVRIIGFLRHWIEREAIGTDFDKFVDLVTREQLMVSCSKELKLWIKEQKPKTVDELVDKAEAFQQAHKSSKQQSDNTEQSKHQGKNSQQKGKPETRTCFICKNIGHIATNCPSRTNRSTGDKFKTSKFGLCTQAQQDHKVNDYISGVTVKLPGVSCNGNKVQVHGLDIVKGEINSDKVSVLRDTGCSTVFVHSRFTNPDFLTGQTRDICLADGTVKQCPEVCINVSTPYISGDIITLILDTPFADLIVGNYVNTPVPHSMDEVHVTRGEDIFVSDDAVPCHAVETRSQKKKQDVEDRTIDRTAVQRSSDTPISHSIDFSEVTSEFKICDRKQLIELQKTDETLNKVRSYVGDDHQNHESYFMYYSDLLYRVKLRSSPYHAMCNGLCEKFNGVLKKMLKAYARLKPQTWDEYIPYLLFAYREVPNESTGFSPFELLYGRHIRGPLAVLKEEWEEPSTCQNSVLSYLLETREKMRTMAEYATENEKKAKQRQKLYYDRKSRDRKLEVGQKVLILLPTHTSKLLASWKGPFVVTDKVSPADYKVKVRGKDKVFHVNMLKLWHERVYDNEDNSVPTDIAACLNIISGLSTDDDTDDSEMSTAITPVLKRKESADDVRISQELTDEERQQLKELLSEYDDIFSDVPKVTNIIEHRVVTKTDEPIYKRSYPLPYALREKVKQEIDDMLTAGIVEPSNSPYAFPIVLIKKKDNTLRFCVDY